nr:NADH dehydrogenase subunit 6 [Thaia sp. 1 NZ-2023b]
MKMTIMKLMMMTSLVTPFMKNPMSMGLILLTQTMLMIILINKMMYTSWFTMITFLMMIGGLLILFTYMSTMASNESFKIKFNLMLAMLMLCLVTDEMMMDNQIIEEESIKTSFDTNLSLIKIYNSKSMSMTILMVIYLLITMISVSYTVKHHKGPLRSYKK